LAGQSSLFIFLERQTFYEEASFYFPDKPSTSLQQILNFSYVQDIVTDFEHPECMNCTENQWIAFVKNGLLDVSSYTCSPASLSRTWALVFLDEDDVLWSFIQFCLPSNCWLS